MTPLHLTADELKTISTLWDEAISLEPDALPRWRAALQDLSPSVLGALDEMLRRRADEAEDSLLADGIDQGTVFAALSPEPQDRAGSSVGPYRLTKQLGSGGMGTVWLAEREDGLMQRTVALKLPHLWLGTRFLERFVVEREILASLEHPNIARLYEAGVTLDGQPYVVLEYVEGEPFLDYCDGHSLDLRQRLALFLQVLDAVQFAHERHVVHRDLKPSNLMVSRDGQVRLLDFGIAKLLDDADVAGDVTQFGDAAFSPNYASPEQIEGRSVGLPADVYALGVLLFELLTGQRPYSLERSTRAAMLEAMDRAALARPSDAVAAKPDVPGLDALRRKQVRQLRGDLDTLVMTAMHRDPARRFVSARAFADDMRLYLSGKPIRCRPDSRAYRLSCFVSRYKVGVAAAVVVAASLGGGLAASLLSAREARAQEQIARKAREAADQQAQVANKNEQTASAVVEFMESLFGSTPKIVPARETGAITVRQMLDVGAARIDESLKDAPQARMRLMMLIGSMYDELDLPEQAGTLYRKQVLAARALNDPDPRPLIDALVQYGNFLLRRPGDTPPLPLLEEADALLRKVPVARPGDDARRGKMEMDFAYAYGRSSPATAEHHIEMAVAAFKGAKDPIDYGRALAGLSHFQMTGRHLTKAIATLEESIRIGERQDPSRYHTMMMLCLRRFDIGELRDGSATCKQAYDFLAQQFGEQNDITVTVALSLAKTWAAAGHGDDARRLLEGQVTALRGQDSELQRRNLGATYVALSNVEVVQGRPVEADRWLRALSDLRIRDPKGLNQPVMIVPEGARAQVQLLQGNLDAASRTVAAELEFFQANHLPVNPDYMTALLSVEMLAHLGKHDLAEAHQTLERLMRLGTWPSDEPAHPRAPNNLQTLLLRTRLALAEGHFDEAAARANELRSAVGDGPAAADFQHWSGPAEIALGQVDLHAGRAADALRHFDAAVAMAAASGHGSLDLAEGLAWQALARLRQGNLGAARDSHTKARAIVAAQRTVSPVYLAPLRAFEQELTGDRAGALMSHL